MIVSVMKCLFRQPIFMQQTVEKKKYKNCLNKVQNSIYVAHKDQKKFCQNSKSKVADGTICQSDQTKNDKTTKT